jgi:hypothetical protein
VAVASTQLGLHNAIGTSDITLYTAPAGKRTIVKNALARSYSSVVTDLYLEVKRSGTIVCSYVFHFATAGSDGDTANLNTWFVLDAGDSLHTHATSSSCSLIVSGSELTL